LRAAPIAVYYFCRMEIGNFMTATEFAEKINTPYPTVAAWLREGRVPGAELQEIGNLKFWLIPVDVLKDFTRPKKGRPTLTDEEKARRAKKLTDSASKRVTKTKALADGAQTSLFEPPASTAKPKARAKKAGAKKTTKKGGAGQ